MTDIIKEEENLNQKEELKKVNEKKIEDIFTTEEEKKTFEELKKVGFDSQKFLANAYKNIFKEALRFFVDNNIPRIKYFVTSLKDDEKADDVFTIEIDGAKYKLNDNLFGKTEEYNSTEKGLQELYLIDFKELKKEVDKLPKEAFDDLKQLYKDMDKELNMQKTFELEEERAKFHSDFEEILYKLNEEKKRSYINEKVRYADKDSIDKIFEKENFIKIRNGISKTAGIKDFNTSTRSIKTSLVKKINKDIIKLGSKPSNNDGEVITAMISQISELWFLYLLYRKNNLKDLISAVTYLKENENDKELRLDRAKENNFIHKLFYSAFKSHDGRILLPAIVKNFYSSEDIEKSYLAGILLDLAFVIYPKEEKDVQKEETANTALD